VWLLSKFVFKFPLFDIYLVDHDVLFREHTAAGTMERTRIYLLHAVSGN